MLSLRHTEREEPFRTFQKEMEGGSWMSQPGARRPCVCILCKLCARIHGEPVGVGSDFSSLLFSHKPPPFLRLGVLECSKRGRPELHPALTLPESVSMRKKHCLNPGPKTRRKTIQFGECSGSVRLAMACSYWDPGCPFPGQIDHPKHPRVLFLGGRPKPLTLV